MYNILLLVHHSIIELLGVSCAPYIYRWIDFEPRMSFCIFLGSQVEVESDVCFVATVVASLVLEQKQ